MKRQKILVIDDESDARSLLRLVLSEEGYKVYSAGDVSRGLEIVKKIRPELILLDLSMPGIDGIEGLRLIKDIDKDAVVIMITGYGSMESVREAMLLGAYDYITKPFDLDFIKTVIRDGLSGVHAV